MISAFVISLMLFTLGIAGVLLRRDLPRILISVSIILASITLLLVALANGNYSSYSFVLFVWIVEVVEILIALAIFVFIARSGKHDINALQELKW
jgi:NADH-quinone oxidoreductase subunit K